MISKRAPYQNTSVDFQKSQQQITRLLETYGCEGVQWTTVFKPPQVEVKFVLETEINGLRKKLAIKMKPPVFAKRLRSGKHVANLNQSLRLLYWYLKTKLEAISFGLVSVEHEFLSDIVYRLPDGTEKTISEVMIKELGSSDMPKLAWEGR